MMFNNEVTYANQWNTPDNRVYQKKILKFLQGRSTCSIDCPNAWAPEVWEMLQTIEKEYGVQRIIPFAFQWNCRYLWSEIFKRPFEAIFRPKYFWQKFDYEKNRWKRSWLRFRFCLTIYPHTWTRLVRICAQTAYCDLYNWWYEPLISISQLKEKYGELRLYHGSSFPGIEEAVEKLLHLTEVRLAMKGAYYPLENLVNAGCSRSYKYEPCKVEYKKDNKWGPWSVIDYTYRKAILDLGINLEDLQALAKKNAQKEKRAAARKAKKGVPDEVKEEK